MNKITLHIEYLLRLHECVIVPGLGAFVTVMQPAVYDSGSGMFMPPLRRVMFNATINSDDGLLATSYSRHSGMKYEKARRALDNDIEALQSTLSQTGTVRIGKVGTLSKNEDGQISFSPLLSSENVMSQLGCTPVSCVAAAKPSAAVEAIYSVSAEKVLNRDKYYYIPVHKTFVKVAASMIAILAVALALMVNPYRSSLRSVEASVMPIEKVLRLHSFGGNGSVKEVAPVNVEEEVSSAEVMPAVNAEKSGESAIEGEISGLGRYNLVVGAFVTESEAARYVASFNGSEAGMQVAKRGRHYLVVLSSDDNKEKIVSLLNSQLVKNQYTGAWIWEKGEKK